MDYRHRHYHCAECDAELPAGGDVVRINRAMDFDRSWRDNTERDWVLLCSDCGEVYGEEGLQRAANDKADDVHYRLHVNPEWGAHRTAEENAIEERCTTVEGYREHYGTWIQKPCRGCTRTILHPRITRYIGAVNTSPKDCSQYCAWRRHKAGERTEQDCLHCQKTFMPKSRKARFCSTRCRTANHRANH